MQHNNHAVNVADNQCIPDEEIRSYKITHSECGVPFPIKGLRF